MLYPLTFEPIFQERVWGDRRLGTLFKKPLPLDQRIGESWEISDRPDAISVIANGPFTGRDLHWLMDNHAEELLGEVPSHDGRFPWLAKLLDANEDLSVQVHPPSNLAEQLGGEPKTEVWHIAQAEPGARLIAGLKRGTTRDSFESRLGQSNFLECLHEIPANKGDSIFIPSGRLHALGAGTVVFEIQQNSDTTFRVFDWNRAGLDDQSRKLHIDKALQSIDFTDIEPHTLPPAWDSAVGHSSQTIADVKSVFRVDHVRLDLADAVPLPGQGMRMLAVTNGQITLNDAGDTLTLTGGQFALVPASVEAPIVQGEGAQFLLTQAA
jgi:mannose-6-phosphate isomerase